MTQVFFQQLNNQIRLTTCPVLECAVRVADETSNRTIECPVLAQMINQSYILIIKFINQCGLVVRIADAMLSRVLINTRTLTQNFKVKIFNFQLSDFVKKTK
jgi:dimeric dUTPase (all-alpha-NTP-PPase superfamily)